MASPVAADIIIHLFVLDQVCLVAATSALLSNALRARRVQAGQQGAGGPAGRRQEQSSCTSYVLRRVCTSSLEVGALSFRTKNQL